jgi:hypothetical protein
VGEDDALERFIGSPPRSPTGANPRLPMVTLVHIEKTLSKYCFSLIFISLEHHWPASPEVQHDLRDILAFLLI